MSHATDYWRNNRDLKHITPNGIQWPEGNLIPALQRICKGSVFEFGCGPGRLSLAFNPGQYIGMDINPIALETARERNQGYLYGDSWEPADTVLAYTVLLHIPDDEIKPVIARMQGYGRIVIGEIMERKWRRPGDPPVFNRDPEEYCELVGRSLSQVERVKYPRYRTDLLLLAFDS